MVEMIAGGVDKLSEDEEDPMTTIPEEVMENARMAIKVAEEHEVIGLIDSTGSKLVLEAKNTALATLSSQADEIEPYWAVSCLGSTGAGKSFFITKLLNKMDYEGNVPYSIDFSEIDGGDIPISVTCNISCYIARSKLLFDVEGTDGTLPLVQRILMNIGTRLRLSDKEKKMQTTRRAAVAEFFPPIAFAISNTVIYITREPLKNSSTSQAIQEFARRIAEASTSVRPYLVVVHNLCPINQLRRGKETEDALVQEFLRTHDDGNFLSKTFRGICCMTFPDCNVVDKRKRIDGEEVFDQQLTRLCELLSQQYSENIAIRRKLHCALPPRSLLTILPQIVDQINMSRPVSIPDILRNDLKNKPDRDCQVLKQTWEVVVSRYGHSHSGVWTGQLLKETLSLCIGISAHYLSWKLATQNKAGFPDEWTREQAASLLDKLLDYFNMVFARCQAVSPHKYEDLGTPVKCGAMLLGHDCHISQCPVIPSRSPWVRRRLTMKVFGGIFDRWDGSFEFDPVLKDAGNWGKKIMQDETVSGVHFLRVSAQSEGVASGSAAPAGQSSHRRFHQHNAEHLRKWCEKLEISPTVAPRDKSLKSLEDQSLNPDSPFCCVCFKLVASSKVDLHICSECTSLCNQHMEIRIHYPHAWDSRAHFPSESRLQTVEEHSPEFKMCNELLEVNQPSQLGQGRDAEPLLLPYMRLKLKYVWRIENPNLWQKYASGRHEVVRDLRALRQRVGETKVLSTRLDAMTQDMLQEADTDAGSVVLLHGTKPEFVLSIVNRGMNERLASGEAAFGSGVYLCEDPEKMDQYCRAATHEQAKRLQAELFVPEHAGNLEGLCFCLAVRAACGQPLYTRGLTKDVDSMHDCDTRKAVFLDKQRRQLAQIPGTDPSKPIYYHSLVVETGKALKRFREIVVNNDTRVYAEYLIAYERI